MDTPNTIPAAEQIRAKLSGLTREQVGVLAECSETPFATIWKIRSGETPNPGIETCRKFWPFVDVVRSGCGGKTAAADQAGG